MAAVMITGRNDLYGAVSARDHETRDRGRHPARPSGTDAALVSRHSQVPDQHRCIS